MRLLITEVVTKVVMLMEARSCKLMRRGLSITRSFFVIQSSYKVCFGWLKSVQFVINSLILLDSVVVEYLRVEFCTCRIDSIKSHKCIVS